jgi:hypothetical protein
MLPQAHFATVYAKPKGRPLVDTFVTEVSQDTWIYFPWDLGYSFVPPIAKMPATEVRLRPAGVMELVDIRDLKSRGPRPCGFESRRPHHL